MTPAITVDLRDDSFTTQKELTALINAKITGFDRCSVEQVVITHHQHQMLKLELAETFQFRWKNLRDKYLDNIDGIRVVLAEDDVEICENCGRLHNDE